MTPSERHNALAREFVKLAGQETRTVGEISVVLESVITAAMLLNVHVHKVAPQVACGLVEAAVQRAVERFSQQMRNPR